MKFKKLKISDVLEIQPTVFTDDRGFFFESFNQGIFEDFLNKKINFVQDNHSHSVYGVLRGLHFQKPPFQQGKLVRVINGSVFDVAVDIRPGSPTFGKWVGEILSSENKKQLWIPEGFAHGYLTLSESADFLYKVTNYYSVSHEMSILYNDPRINIDWPSVERIFISEKDSNASFFDSIDFKFLHD